MSIRSKVMSILLKLTKYESQNSFWYKNFLFNIVKFGDILLEQVYWPILAVFRLFASLRQTPCSYTLIHHQLGVNHSLIMSLRRFFNNIYTNLTNFHHFHNLTDRICVGLRTTESQKFYHFTPWKLWKIVKFVCILVKSRGTLKIRVVLHIIDDVWACVDLELVLEGQIINGV